MTQENKQLLFKDLCARLPYGVICNDNRYGSGRVTNIDITPDDIEHKNLKVVLYYFDFDEYGELNNCKPYLRPMSSMTEKEEEEYMNIDNRSYSCPMIYAHIPASDRIDWLLKNHFDYLGLIPMGLALEAPEGMYN